MDASDTLKALREAEDGYLLTTEAAKFLGWTYDRWYSFCYRYPEQEPPHKMFGKKKVYLKSDLIKWRLQAGVPGPLVS